MNSNNGYVWLVYGWYGPWPDGWNVNTNDEAYKCSYEQIYSMVQESIAIDHARYARDDNDTMTDLGIVR